MVFHQIAKITFEAEIKVHPQAIKEEFEFNASRWYRNGRTYIKDDGLSRYALQKIDSKLFVLTIEQLDLFPIDLGDWSANDYPERETLINETLDEIEKEAGCRIRVIGVSRNAM